ncbi:DoxX family protein [Mycobacteroides chelonae]|uniref:DoxX family protein n=1 Tax=Mycobacteroides chelonae TaxID=1774 RepID=UPI0008A8A7A0|nr:DoxX family protein [Mycobacteroides chelonae]AYM42846.1 DoxX family protein [[Mycobacterium] chelonae subsp. gwanakae]MDM1885808.1 DoxX family protein [Mycobacteroides abscessus]MDM1889141.1 DoxX family protein [Mycobacteroides abscessus]OHU09394.1 phosphoribosylaminoimidazolecarboxamide formyltransferase [Mycobacteroides chelonae]
MSLKAIENRLMAQIPIVLSVFRIVVGFLFFCYGTAHLFGWPVAAFQQPFGTIRWWAGVVELVAGSALILGIGTRMAAFISSGAMAVAYFVQHQPVGWLPIQNKGDLAALYSWIFLLLTFTGGGKFSLDSFLGRHGN